MAQYTIAVIVGSLRKDSFNRKLADALARLAPADFAFRQLRIDDLPLDTIPEGTLLAMRNSDKPGVVGHTGTVLSAAGINIAGMEVGRNRPGGTAVSIWRVDAPVPQDVLDKVKSHPAILSVKMVQL